MNARRTARSITRFLPSLYVGTGNLYDARGDLSALRPIPVLSVIVLGLLIFLRAAPTNASRRHLIVRLIVYATIMLMFYGGIRNYLWYDNLCSP